MAKGPAQRGDGGRSPVSKDDVRPSGMGDQNRGSGYAPGVSGKAPAAPDNRAYIDQALAQSSAVNKAASDGLLAVLAARAPRQPAVPTGMATPANAYVSSFTPRAQYSVGDPITPEIAQMLADQGVTNFNPAGTMTAETAQFLMREPTRALTPQQVYGGLTSNIGATPPQQPSPQALTPQQVYGGLTSNIGATAPTQPTGPNGYAPQLLPGVGFSFGEEAPAELRAPVGSFPQQPATGARAPFSMGTLEPLAPTRSPKPSQRPAQVEATANAYPYDAVMQMVQEQYDALPPDMRMGAMATTPLRQSNPFIEPGSYLPPPVGSTATAAGPGPGLQVPNAPYLPSIGGTTPPPSAAAPTQPTQAVTPGRLMPQAGAMDTRAAIGQYSPSASPSPVPVQTALAPTTSPRPQRAPAFQTEGYGQTYSDGSAQMPSLAPASSILPSQRPIAPTQAPTQTPAAPAQTPTPQPTQISAQDIAQNTAATSGGTPIEYSAGVVPSSATMPGLGLMSGIQQGIGAIRDVFSGDRQLFGENGMLPADTRNPETRASDWFAAQEEMSRGSEMSPYPESPTIPTEAEFAAMSAAEQQAVRDRLTNNPYGAKLGMLMMGGRSYEDIYPYIFGTTTGADTTEPTPYMPEVPAPYYTPSTLSPYVPSAAQTNPAYGYSSYNSLRQAMGMAEGGVVRPSMNNAFTPGTYYARYNPYARGLGALRRD